MNAGKENPASVTAENGAHEQAGQNSERRGKDTTGPSLRKPPGKPDGRTAERFLQALAPGGRFAFQTFADAKGDGQGALTWTAYGTVRERWSSLAHLNGEGAGVFFAVNDTGGKPRKTENIVSARALFLDFDQRDELRPGRLAALPLPPSITVETSEGKQHAYWPVDGLSIDDWRRLQSLLCDAFADEGADSQASKLAGVMRVPGFWHCKAEPFQSRLLRCERRRYSVAELRTWLEALTPTDEAERSAAEATGGEASANVAALPVRGVTIEVAREALAQCPDADREYGEWLAVGMALHHQFNGSVDAWRVWDEWSAQGEKYAGPEDTWGKWQTFGARTGRAVTMRSVLQEAEGHGWERPPGVEGAPAAAEDFPLLPAAEDQRDQDERGRPRGRLLHPVGERLRNPPRLVWIVRGVMEHPTIGQLFGESRSGKSFVALDLAACIATGTDWHGHGVTQGAVVYIAGEGHAGVLRRLKAWEVARETPLDDAPLYVSRAAVHFSDPGAVKTLYTELDELTRSPALIVVDTLARATAGWDENSTKDMGAFMAEVDRLSRRYKCSVLLVHHTGHGDRERGRGSSSVNAALDMSARVAQGPNGVISLHCTKMKDGPEFAPEHFTLEAVELDSDWKDSDDEQISSAVLTPTEGRETRQRPTGKNQKAALEVAEAMAKEDRREDGEPVTLRVDEWRKRCEQRGVDRKRFPEARRALASESYITTGADDETFKLAPPLFPDEDVSE